MRLFDADLASYSICKNCFLALPQTSSPLADHFAYVVGALLNSVAPSTFKSTIAINFFPWQKAFLFCKVFLTDAIIRWSGLKIPYPPKVQGWGLSLFMSSILRRSLFLASTIEPNSLKAATYSRCFSVLSRARLLNLPGSLTPLQGSPHIHLTVCLPQVWGEYGGNISIRVSTTTLPDLF